MVGPRVLVDRYTLVRQLGAGAQGTVWLARDDKLRREVAVKQVSNTDQRFGEAADIARERAMREGRIAARLSHPNAVSVYDVALHDGNPWLVMEYVPSRTLTEVVREQGGIPPKQAAALGAQIAGALAEAHRLGIVHRDVKPSNILITADGRAKITDFGIARGNDDATLTATGLVTGTPAYFAPELARGMTGPTPATDVWSLGATLYYAVEGTPPFGTDENPLVLLGRIASQEVQRPVRAGELEHVLLRMLSRDDAMRPTMTQVRAMLATVGGEISHVPLLLAEPNTEENDAVFDEGPDEVPDATKVSAEPVVADEVEEREPKPETEPEPELLPEPEPEPEPQSEPSTAQALDSGEPAPLLSPPPPLPPARDRRRTRGIVLIAAAGIVLALAGLGSYLLLNPDEPEVTANPQQTTQQPREPEKKSPEADPSPTDSPSPTPSVPVEEKKTPPATKTPVGSPMRADRMTALVSDYYGLLPGDPEQAWTWLGPVLQKQGYGSYTNWWSQVRSVSISNLRADPSSGTVTGTVRYVMRNGGTSSERTRLGLIKTADGKGLLINTDD
jgi:eukaryotic-like serine/threonine-protein kinase